MSDQSYGLRFDIYERVHLSAEEVGIDELEEVELYPRIQVIPGDEYAMLRGHLLLTGLYRGEDETRELSHLIPVEITVPLSRVNRLEDISVEIENFDVDLLNERSLNVTGVLSLQGIETAAFAQQPQEWNSREYTASYEPGAETAPWISGEAQFDPKAGTENVEAAEPPFSAFPQTSFAGQQENAGLERLGQDGFFNQGSAFAAEPAEQQAQVEQQIWQQQAWQEQNRQEQREQQEQQGQEAGFSLPEFNFEALAGPNPDFVQRENDAVSAQAQDYFQDTPAAVPAWKQETFHEEQDVFVSSEEPEAKTNIQPEAKTNIQPEAKTNIQPENKTNLLPEAAENKELVEPEAKSVFEEPNEPVQENALSSANEAPAKEEEKSKEPKVALGSQKKNQVQKEHFGFSQLLHNMKPKSSDESETRPEDEAEFEDELQADPEDRYWKQAFISNLSESPFRKLRMVIVQREETIDDIALRYNLNARELLLHNRLSEQNISEGQVLYLP